MDTSFPIHYVFRVINSIVLIAVLLFLFSCSAVEILPGLCYTDKDGTYLCPTEETTTDDILSGELQCTDYGMMEYCEGRTESSMRCICVNHNDFTDPTDFLWR